MLLFRACSGIMVHIEEKYPVRGLYLKFAKRKQIAHLKGLLTKVRLRGIVAGKIYYAVDNVFQFASAYIDRSLDFAKRCDLTPMSVLYTEVLGEVLFDEKKGGRVGGEFMRLPS